MSPINPLYLAHQLKRCMRPNAYLFVRPDWRRFVRPGFEDDHPFALYERKYHPDQARVPAGSREGGRWTDDGGGYRTPGRNSRDEIQVAGTVIRICIAGSSSRFTIGGIRSYSVTYDCSGGRSFVRQGSGHDFPAIIIDPF